MDEGKEEAGAKKTEAYVKPVGSRRSLEAAWEGGKHRYEAEADWVVLRKEEKPQAEMFYVRYFLDGAGDRPLTFVFNGGPGASSVYLHLGAMGPRRVDFREGGDALPPPHALVDNEETWLRFTDLVFIDPVGTGLSRMIRDGKKEEARKEGEGKAEVEYWKLQRDLESLGEFIRSFLSRFHRWESPVYVAGESYGGFRVAKLARLLQEGYGVGLSGAILISPALEFTLLDGSDYDALMWLDSFPSMAGAAAFHGRARKRAVGEDMRSYMARAADFALTELLPVLAGGELVGEERRRRILQAAADYVGLPRETLLAKNGRVEIQWFVKNLLRDRGLHLGLYDASLAVRDPFPDRDEWSGPDPTLHVVERVFASGINSRLRREIGLESERDYALLSLEVNENWKVDTRGHALDSQVGATDDLRYGMSLNPDMRVYVTHGIFDLVTPYFATERITRLMKLDGAARSRLTVRHYEGGHMFYTWKASREAFFSDMRAFYRVAGGGA